MICQSQGIDPGISIVCSRY